jgi:hypothetical protein
LGIAACAVALLLSAAGPALAGPQGEFGHATVHTDGHLTMGKLETISAKGFPGEGDIEIAFFPSTICENSCGAASFSGAKTDAAGKVKVRLRMPGFFYRGKKRVPFLDHELLEVEVIWMGTSADGEEEFDIGSAYPEPEFIRPGAPSR